MSDINIPALKAAALAANNGQPWLAIEDLDYALVANDVAQEEDCDYIALANPATVLALIERLEKLEAVAKAARDSLGPQRHSHGFSESRERCSECQLRDSLAALEAAP